MSKEQKAFISRNSIIKKKIKYSFIFEPTLVQLVNKHSGIKRVVKRTKNMEIPSTPIVRFKFKLGIQKVL